MPPHPEAGLEPVRPGRRIAAASHGLLVGLSVFVLSLSQVADYDVWWHIANGEWMLWHGELPRLDTFSHTAAGQPDVIYSWLFDLTAALAARGVGIGGLPWIQAATAAAAFLALFVAGGLLGLAPGARAIGLLAVAPLLRFHLVLRPHLASYLCLALLVLLLAASGRGRRARVLGAAVLLIWLWRQLHASTPLGLGVLAAFLVFPDLLRPPLPIEERGVPWLRRSAVLLAASLCLVLPPLGWEGTRWIADTLRLVAGRGGLVAEWAPPASFVGGFGPFWLYAGLGVVGLLGSRSARTPLSVGLYAASCLLALSGIRHIAPFVFLTVLPVTAAWTDLAARGARRLALGGWPRRAGTVLGLIAASAWCLASGFGAVYPPFGLGVVDYAFPAGAAGFVERTGLRGRMYNTHRLGGYLIWRLGEGGQAQGRKVFWDGRLLLYRPLFEQLDQAASAPDPSQALDRLLERYGVDFAILDYRDEHPLALRLREQPSWALVHWDDSAYVLVRRDGPGQRLLATEWRSVRPWDRGLTFLERAGPELLRVRAELARKLQEEPDCSRAMAMYGTLLLRLGQVKSARTLLQRFLRAEKESEWVRLVLAQALLLEGRPREALEALEPLRGGGRSRTAAAQIEAEARGLLSRAGSETGS
jgi:hypothetical protein